LPTPPQDQATLTLTGAPGVRYAYRASLVGAAHQFELTEQGLAWRIAAFSAARFAASLAVIARLWLRSWLLRLCCRLRWLRRGWLYGWIWSCWRGHELSCF